MGRTLSQETMDSIERQGEVANTIMPVVRALMKIRDAAEAERVASLIMKVLESKPNPIPGNDKATPKWGPDYPDQFDF